MGALTTGQAATILYERLKTEEHAEQTIRSITAASLDPAFPDTQTLAIGAKLISRLNVSIEDEDRPTLEVATDILSNIARASKPEQEAFIGNQSGGRVFLFLSTDDFRRDYNDMVERGINFIREPKKADYGTVAVFEDLYGNLWDLVQFDPDHL